MRTALASVRERPAALEALKRECERLVRYTETRYAECKASADQAISEFGKAIGAQESLPHEVEQIFMARYVLEAERADHDVKIARRLRDMAYAGQ